MNEIPDNCPDCGQRFDVHPDDLADADEVGSQQEEWLTGQEARIEAAGDGDQADDAYGM